jgi:toxin ParE1/3/4
VTRRLSIHRLAQAELRAIFRHIANEGGAVTAQDYVGGIYALIDGLRVFPERGTVRPGSVPGLRIIGYRRSASIAFTVEAEHVTILGVFRRVQNVTSEILSKRL